MKPATLLKIYRWVFAALLVIAGVHVLTAAHASARHAMPLAVAEMIGAVLLVSRRTQAVGAALLLGVFAAAFALQRSWPTDLLQYASSSLLIVLMDRALSPPTGR